jgi:hypothetical protein
LQNIYKKGEWGREYNSNLSTKLEVGEGEAEGGERETE